MVFNIFQALGVLGLILIISALLQDNKKLRVRRYIFATIGGILLLSYSIYIGDLIFIILQLAYIIIAFYELLKWKTKK